MRRIDAKLDLIGEQMSVDDERSPSGIEPHLAQHGRISYITIPARDPITSAVFYEAVFGWTLTPPDDVRVSWELGPRDNERVPFSDTPTGLIGAFVAERGPSADGVLVHIYVEDIEQVIREIEERGCEIVDPVHDDGGMRWALFRDPGRNVVAIWSAGSSSHMV